MTDSSHNSDEQAISNIRNRAQPSTEMLAFANPNPERDYLIRIDIPEFSCICPVTGHPDYAHLLLEYIADQKCVELKSLKLYLWSFRDRGAYHEAVTNEIVNKLVKLLDPRFIRLTAKFNVRGGIYTDVIAEHTQTGWSAAPMIHLPPS